MADFRQLALDFVLSNDEDHQTTIAKKAATELKTGDTASNPVARWVESVQPWMPGNNEDEVVAGGDNPDWTSRAKALEFLSQSLRCLDLDVLKPSQVKLLVGFFGAMFDIDHKAGIMASATALSRIHEMKAFQPSMGNEIIQKLNALGDDFSRQVAKTRLAVYELLRALLTDFTVAADLQKRHGQDAAFMSSLIKLCSSERDPDCLLVWFDILRLFLTQYTASDAVLEEVYNNFKAYFPITLPRIAQSNVTPDELKMSLRRCFSSNQRLAHLTIPFLVGKMDQGASVTVNVKIDILKTLQHCLDQYEDKSASVSPYVSSIWGSLKYEVRNGESEDTIWATLETLKTLATCLDGDDLRDYALSVTRDCVTDLSNITYTAPAGRLIVSVLSASIGAFVLMVSPTITHVKDNLRHPKTPSHSQDLLKILHVVLETRLLLSKMDMSDAAKHEFSTVDSVFKNLYADVLKPSVQAGSHASQSEDDVKISAEAVQAAGALISQHEVNALADSVGAGSARLLPTSTCLEIMNDLFTIISQTAWQGDRKPSSDDLLNETTRSLARGTQTYPEGFDTLAAQAVSIIRHSWPLGDAVSVRAIQTLGPMLAYVGCSSLCQPASASLPRFVNLLVTLTNELKAAVEAKADAQSRRAITVGIESVMRYFNDACAVDTVELQEFDHVESWHDSILSKYPQLQSLWMKTEHIMATDREAKLADTPAGIRNDYLLISLYVTRQLYSYETITNSDTEVFLRNYPSGSLSSSEYQYLHHISSLAGFVVHQMSEAQQLAIGAQDLALTLFSDEVPVQNLRKSWAWLACGSVNVLSFGIFNGLRPMAISRLFENGVAPQIITSALSTDVSPHVMPVTLSMLSVLANKHPIENLPELMSSIESIASTAMQSGNTVEAVSKMKMVYAITCGTLRRYSSKKAEPILSLVRSAQTHKTLGRALSQRAEMLVAPQSFLTKDHFAVVKPLWMQRTYFELISPMLQSATDPEVDAEARTNYSLAAILMLRHMSFSIYEADVDKVLRIAIATAQAHSTGAEVLASLDVLQNILLEAPEKGQDHIRSIINISIDAFTGKGATQKEATTPEVAAGCGKLALEIVGGMPRMFETRRLIPFVPQLERELTLACGHGVRDVRRLARLARQAWAPLK